MRKSIVVSLALAALLAGGWVYRERQRPIGYILISIDTLRADHLGAYGYPLDTSPFFDELAKRGNLFENAIVQVPGTLPSHMSIFTGLYPDEHGVLPPDGVLSKEIPTLPEIFNAAGYRTAGFTEGGYVSGRYGFERGFDIFREANTGKPGVAGRTFDLAKDWIDTLAPGDKFFLFLHTYEVHDPYIPMEPFGANSWPGPAPATWEPTGANLTAASYDQLEFTPEVVEYFAALYDAGIRYVDEVLRSFMQHVWAAGLSRRTTVVITSDHGEEFQEHGSFVHRQIYNETLHVPLLVRRLGQRRGARIGAVVESIDIAPTLLELAGLEERAAEISGSSLVPLFGRPGPVPGSEAYAEGVAQPTRTLVRQTKSGLYQFLYTRNESGKGLLPVRRALVFDWVLPRLTFRARSHQSPQLLEILVDGSLLRTAALQPERSILIDLVLPVEKRTSRIELRVATCEKVEVDAPPSSCVGFFVEGLAAERRELYNIDVDPLEKVDLSALHTAVSRELELALNGHLQRERERERATREELTDEQIEQLKALGYLQ